MHPAVPARPRAGVIADVAFLAVLVIVGATSLAWYGLDWMVPRWATGSPTGAADLVGHLLGHPPTPLPTPSIAGISSGEFQSLTEAGLREQLPGMVPLVRGHGAASRAVYRAGLALVPAGWAPLAPVADGTVEALMPARLSGVPVFYYASAEAGLRAAAARYNQLARESPERRFYVLYVPAVCDLLASAGVFVPSVVRLLEGDRNTKSFRQQLQPDVAFTSLGEDLSVSDAIDLYYRSDHHPNTRGAYHGYRQLYELFRRQIGSLDPPLEPTRWFTFPNAVFRGTLARLGAGYLGVEDSVTGVEFKQAAALSATVAGWPAGTLRPSLPLSLAPVPPGGVSAFENYYTSYCGGDFGLVTLESRPARGGVLLVVGDSNDNCMTTMLASHFSTSYFVDPRYYVRDTGGEFSLGAFVRDHAVTDVVFIGGRWTIGLGSLSGLE